MIVSALPVTAAAADDFPDNALIIVGGKTVTKDMGLSDVKKLFGEPKLETESPFGGKACTFYGDNYSDYLYIETNAKDGIAAFGSISEGYRTPKYSFGETLKLGAALQPTAPKNAMVYWSTSDVTVANVSPNGVVTALKEGTVTITAMSEDGGLKDTCVITVGKKEETLMGDVNLDGVLSIADATMVQSCLAQSVRFNDKQIAAADFNNDGSISVADVTAIQTAIANS